MKFLVVPLPNPFSTDLMAFYKAMEGPARSCQQGRTLEHDEGSEPSWQLMLVLRLVWVPRQAKE